MMLNFMQIKVISCKTTQLLRKRIDCFVKTLIWWNIKAQDKTLDNESVVQKMK